MKWFIASDIHGSAFYCKRLIEAYKSESADRLILLGDILYHGPRNDLPKEYDPKAVIDMLNAFCNEITSVRGNCDSDVDQMVFKFPVLADYAMLAADKKTVFLTHGHKYCPENPPPLKAGDILLCGHTHIPACQEIDGYTYLNPGSVSIPKDGSANGYMVFEDNIFIWKDLDGNIYKTFEI